MLEFVMEELKKEIHCYLKGLVEALAGEVYS